MRLRNMTGIYLLHGEDVFLLYRKNGRVVTDTYVPSAGGHFEKDELNDARACVLRELNEELHLTEAALTDFSLRYVCLRNNGDEVRQNYYFFARLKDEYAHLPLSNEGTCVRVPLEKCLEYPMPVTAKLMMRHYLATGRYTNALYGCIVSGENATFVEMNP